MTNTKTTKRALMHRTIGSAKSPLIGTLLLAAAVAGFSGCKKDESGMEKAANDLHDAAVDAKDEIKDEAAEAKDKIKDEARDAKDEMKDAVDDRS